MLPYRESCNLVVRDLVTNPEGLYAATLLPVGEYPVTVEAKGFRKATQPASN